MILNEKAKYYFFLFAKIAIALVAFYFIYEKISIQPWDEIEAKINEIDRLSFLLLFPILLLSVINWMAEVLKWQILSEQIKPISYKESLRIVLSSFAVSTITPNRVGEYGAKILYYNKSDWKKILSYNFFGNMMQLLVTLLMVVVSYFFLPSNILAKIPLIGYFAILLFSIILMIFLFKKHINISIPWISNNIKLSLWDNIDFGSRLKILIVSSAKYLAFSIQFMLMLSIFTNENLLFIFAIIALYYLITSVIPTVFISDLLVKGSVSIVLFSFIGVDEITVIAVVLSAWIINFVIPTLFGVYHLLKKESD